MNIITSIKNSRFIKNASWIIFCRIYQALVNFVVALLTARYLGPANYGLISYAASLSALMTAFCSLGINDVIVNELVVRPKESGVILGTSVFYRLCSTALSIVTICLFAFASAPNDPLKITVTALYSISLLFKCFELIKYWYQAKLMSKIPSVISCIAYTLVAAYKIVLLILGKGVIWFALSTSVDFAAIAVMLLVSYRYHAPKDQKLRICPRRELPLLKRSSAFMISTLMVSVYGQVDKIMLEQLLGVEYVGYYTAALTISGIWTFVLSAITDSARPIILAAYSQDNELFEKRLTQLYSAIIYICLVVALGMTLFAELFIKILYGDKYLPSVPILQISTWSTAFSYLGVARSIYLIPKGLQKYEKWIALLGAVCNLMLNFILIPRCGAVGAALATLSTQIIANFVVGFFFGKIRRNNILIIRALLCKEIIQRNKKER